ncbi:MAG TPA: NAD(P)-dependent oxidoreductase [Steroidobacteraceae bacterium]|nr:NAD(P)-dependent oxidoreductase [Steroidobacteraceae bacterium]
MSTVSSVCLRRPFLHVRRRNESPAKRNLRHNARPGHCNLPGRDAVLAGRTAGGSAFTSARLDERNTPAGGDDAIAAAGASTRVGGRRIVAAFGREHTALNLAVGFIGLGNVGGALAGNLVRHGVRLTVRDLDPQRVAALVARGAQHAVSPRALAEAVEVVITCLPSPAVSAEVMEAPDGVLAGLGPGKVWLEMSTTDAAEARRLAALVEARGGSALDCPVSGGCHRAATGNISIFAGGSRATFERVLPLLSILGRRILHTGPLGSASVLKVITNYLCTVHLAALAEALTVARVAGLDLNTTYEGIRISSGNSFVHETESQVILNGSRDINFTMDLVVKDVGLFDALARAHGVPLELSPLVLGIFQDGARRYGPREHSPNIIRRLEDACGVRVLGEGFPAQIVDDEPKVPGLEVVPKGRAAPDR